MEDLGEVSAEERGGKQIFPKDIKDAFDDMIWTTPPRLFKPSEAITRKIEEANKKASESKLKFGPVNIPTTISSPKIYPDDIKIHHTTGTNPDYLKPTTTCSSSTKSQDILEEINIPNTFIPTNKEIAEPTGLSGNIEKELEYELVFDPVKHVDKSKVLGPGNSTIEIMTQCLSCQNYNPNLKNCGLDSNAIAKDLSGRCYTYRKKLEDKPDLKCLCEVYNICGSMGCIAINKDCPFHGHLLNGKSAL
jgi:hypothetical protein